MRNVVEGQLTAKGYELVPSGRADLTLACHIDTHEKHTNSVNDFIEYRESGGKEGPQESYVFGYQEGTVIIEAYDTAERLVWRGAAAPIINPESQQEKVREALLRIMERFPSR